MVAGTDFGIHKRGRYLAALALALTLAASPAAADAPWADAVRQHLRRFLFERAAAVTA